MEFAVSNDGTKIAFERSGSGPSVILIASALADHQDANRFARNLSKQFTVLNYDRRGRGQSDAAADYTVAREIEDVSALVRAAGGSAAIFGSSSGAVLALEAAASLADRVSRIVLFEPPLRTEHLSDVVSTDDIRHMEELLAANRRSEVVREFMERHLGVPSTIVSIMRILPMWSKMKKLAHTVPYDLTLIRAVYADRASVLGRWAGIRAQALVITGAKSGEVFQTAARELTDVLPYAHHEVLDGANHSAVMAAPKGLAAVAAPFLLADARTGAAELS
jgi:pimeloyl-ACP methyl ester carboxylesterase